MVCTVIHQTPDNDNIYMEEGHGSKRQTPDNGNVNMEVGHGSTCHVLSDLVMRTVIISNDLVRNLSEFITMQDE